MEYSAGQPQPHAVLDPASRRSKGLMIGHLRKISMRKLPIRTLKIGAGSLGHVCCFSTHSRLVCDVDAADDHDKHPTSDDHRFIHAHLRGLTQTSQAW